MKYDFSLDACFKSAMFQYLKLNANPFEELGRSIIRKSQGPLFNTTMIKAWELVIEKAGLKWDSK